MCMPESGSNTSFYHLSPWSNGTQVYVSENWQYTYKSRKLYLEVLCSFPLSCLPVGIYPVYTFTHSSLLHSEVVNGPWLTINLLDSLHFHHIPFSSKSCIIFCPLWLPSMQFRKETAIHKSLSWKNHHHSTNLKSATRLCFCSNRLTQLSLWGGKVINSPSYNFLWNKHPSSLDVNILSEYIYSVATSPCFVFSPLSWELRHLGSAVWKILHL